MALFAFADPLFRTSLISPSGRSRQNGLMLKMLVKSAGEVEMNNNAVQDEIRELNLAYLMLAQRMLNEDREGGMFRLGISAEAAELLVGLSSAQLLRMASSQMVLARFRFGDEFLTGLLAGRGRDQASSSLHAAILATSAPVAGLS
jgi:flagellar transcriptional activator FlhD